MGIEGLLVASDENLMVLVGRQCNVKSMNERTLQRWPIQVVDLSDKWTIDEWTGKLNS